MPQNLPGHWWVYYWIWASMISNERWSLRLKEKVRTNQPIYSFFESKDLRCSRELPIVLEESMEYSLNQWRKTKRLQHIHTPIALGITRIFYTPKTPPRADTDDEWHERIKNIDQSFHVQCPWLSGVSKSCQNILPGTSISTNSL